MSGDRAFQWTLEQLASAGVDERAAYRVRELRRDCTGDPTFLTLIDGVGRIDYKADGLLIEYVESRFTSVQVDPAVARLYATYYCYATGEIAQSSTRPGGVDPLVLLDTWESVPSEAFYLRGVIPSWIRRSAKAHTLPDIHGREVVEYLDVNGSAIVHLDKETGDLCFVQVTSFVTRRIHSIELSSYVTTESGSRAPCWVVERLQHPDSCVENIKAWIRADGEWAREVGDCTIPAQSRVNDLRGKFGVALTAVTDRPMSLQEVLYWPIETSVDAESASLPAQLQNQNGSVAADVATYPAQVVVAVSLIVAMFLVVGLVTRRRKGESR